MRRSHRALVACVLAALALFSAPAAAGAANAYGQTFAGQSKCLECHGDVGGYWQVSAYAQTAHAQDVIDVRVATSALVPSASSKTLWPSPAVGGGFGIGPSDIWLQQGAPGDTSHEYISFMRNDTTHTLSTGFAVAPISGPSDDWWMFNGPKFVTADNAWEIAGPTKLRTYFQSCGGCHNLGVTRPSDKTYTLANGASMTHSTETSYAGFGVQCEQCHGTGVADATDHHGTGVRVVRTKQALKSQVCGQCHGTGTAKELNYNGTTFSGPNGYTPDKKLEDFFNITDVQYVRTSAASGPVTIPATDTKFYPDGHNKAARYAYYNEWLFSGHANSLRFRGGTKWTSNPRDTCLGCHSGEGFLKRIGYGGGEPNDISSQASSVASDTLNVECGICHVVHSSTTTEPLGLRLPKGQLCQACHYGRLAPGATAVAGSTLRYTQAEMLAGYGLIGVPRRDRPVMGDTDCIDCHMPETYTGRYSHRFTPMMPGDAVAWGVPAGGDSCTKCHTSVPREELQADLDAWASNIASATDDASRAIASARSRAASSSVVGKLLLDSASTNMTFIKADLSQGAHDYPYAKAGLDKSAYFADAVGASFARCTATSYNGATGLAFVYGQLVFGDGSVRADELVTIEAQPVGSTLWAVVDSVRTTARGEFYCAVAPSATTSYRVRWTPLDGAAFLSPVLSVSLTPSTSSTSIAASARSVPLGRYVTISSLVAPPRPGATVQIQYRYGSDSWRSLPAQALDSAGAYRCLFRAPARGTVSFRAVFAGDAIETGSTSGVVSVRVY